MVIRSYEKHLNIPSGGSIDDIKYVFTALNHHSKYHSRLFQKLTKSFSQSPNRGQSDIVEVVIQSCENILNIIRRVN